MGVGKGVVGGQWKLFNCDDRQNVRALSSCRANKPTLRIRGRAQSDGERMSPTSGIGSPPDVGDDFPTWPTSPGKQSGDAWLLLAGFVSPGPERSTADLQNVPFPRQWQVCSPVKQSPLTASRESNVIMEPATDRDMGTAQETRSSNGETDRGDEAGHQALNGHSKPNDSQAPVIIVGAGPVGLLLALRLAQKNIGSIVLDKDSAPSQLPAPLDTMDRSTTSSRRWDSMIKLPTKGCRLADMFGEKHQSMSWTRTGRWLAKNWALFWEKT